MPYLSGSKATSDMNPPHFETILSRRAGRGRSTAASPSGVGGISMTAFDLGEDVLPVRPEPAGLRVEAGQPDDGHVAGRRGPAAVPQCNESESPVPGPADPALNARVQFGDRRDFACGGRRPGRSCTCRGGTGRRPISHQAGRIWSAAGAGGLPFATFRLAESTCRSTPPFLTPASPWKRSSRPRFIRSRAMPTSSGRLSLTSKRPLFVLEVSA